MLGLGHEGRAVLPQHADGAATLPVDSSPFRVIITGSRDWKGIASVWEPLDRLLSSKGRVLVIHGQCPTGADFLAAEWVDEYKNEGASEKAHPADWTQGKQAGPDRNAVMVNEGADMVLAFANPCRKRKPWCPSGQHPSHGTADCVKRARAAGIPVYFCPRGQKW